MNPEINISPKQFPIFNLKLAIRVVVILFMVLGMSELLGQSGVIGGFAALLTGIADRPGSLRQRTFGLTLFVGAGYIPIAVTALIGPNHSWLLVLLFIISFCCAWTVGYGERIGHVCWVLTIWLNLVLDLQVWDNFSINFIGYVAGSLLMMFALIIPNILRGTDLTSEEDSLPLIPPRSKSYRELLPFAVIRALGITLAGFISQKYLQFNLYWIALTTVIIMPPDLKIHWRRGFQRGLGTVLGVIVGYQLVLFAGENDWLLLVFELVSAFLLVYTFNKKPYGMFVFFLSMFIVTQLGRLEGTDIAQAGGNERVLATLMGIIIALITTVIVVFVLRNSREET